MKNIERACLALAFLAAFIIRLYYHDTLSGFDLSSANYDAVDYHWLAKNVCRLRGYHTFFGTGHDYHLLRSPGYPLYIALVYLLFGMQFAALRLADVALSSLSVVLVYLIARELAGRKAAMLAMAIAVFYRPSVYYATRLFSENLFCFLMLLSLLLLLRSGGRSRICAAAGGVTGYMILTRPAWLGVVPFLLVWIVASAGRRLLRTSLFLAGLAAALAPWVIYCRFALGVPFSPMIFSSSLGAENAWAAHNAAIGDFTQAGPAPGREFEHEWTQLTRRRFREYRLSETEYIRKLSTEAATFLRQDPSRCIALGLRRLYRSWLGSGVMDGQGTVMQDTGKNPSGIIHWKRRILSPDVYLGDEEVIEQLPVTRALRVHGVHIPLASFEGVFYLMVLGLIACGAFSLGNLPCGAFRWLHRFSLPLVVSLGYIAANVFGIPIQRYRLPIEYLVIIVAGAGIACALSPLFRLWTAALAAMGIGGGGRRIRAGGRGSATALAYGCLSCGRGPRPVACRAVRHGHGVLQVITRRALCARGQRRGAHCRPREERGGGRSLP